MYTYLVLGQIPGTNIQISFQAWVIITIMAIVFGPTIYRYFTADLNKNQAEEKLHATHLHTRAK